MKITVIRSNIYSDYLNDYIKVELAYPLIPYEQALSMFIREFPECANRHIFTSYEFDSDDKPDLYNAFKHSGCIRTNSIY